jgi:FHA domain
MPFRLRYMQHDMKLSEGEFAVGRSATCQLSLDDPLVSRRHAVLTVSEEAVRIEDLKSRNGVLVNGKRIDSVVDLRPGDRILIGSQEMMLVQTRADARMGQTAQGGIPKMTLSRLEAVGPAVPEADAEPSMLRRVDGFRVLGGVAEKALAMGRAEEAERLLASALTDVIEACRSGRRIPTSLAEEAARFSARLATATSKGAWADYVIELYSFQGRPVPAQVIDELYSAFRKVTSVDVVRLHGYVELLRAQLPKFGPADRFLFQRLEGLERLAVLR